MRTHLWAKLLIALLPPYVAFLGLSRTALITSAHHLQSPQSTLNVELYAFDGFSRSAAAIADLDVSSALLVAPAAAVLAGCYHASLASPRIPTKTSLAQMGLGLHLPLVCTCVVLYPLLGVPVTLAALVGGGWR